MTRARLLLPLALVACTPSLDKAIDYTDKGMAVLDVVVTESTDEYAAATKIAIHHCAAELAQTRRPLRLASRRTFAIMVLLEATADQRNDCLAKQGFSPEQIGKVEEALTLIRDAYDTLAVSLEAMKQALPVIQQARESAKAVK